MATLGRATLLVLVSLVILIVGILMIGDSERTIRDFYGSHVWWEPNGLRLGIFITIMGTLALAGSTKVLSVAWNKDIQESRQKWKVERSPPETPKQ